MRKLIGLAIVIMCAVVSVSAQDRSARSDRNQYVESKSVSLRVEKLPAAEVHFVPTTSFSYPADDFKPGVVRVGPRTTYLKEGLKPAEVVRLLGQPQSISERSEKGVIIATYEFQRGEGQVLIVEFENGRLVHSQTESRAEQSAAADR